MQVFVYSFGPFSMPAVHKWLHKGCRSVLPLQGATFVTTERRKSDSHHDDFRLPQPHSWEMSAVDFNGRFRGVGKLRRISLNRTWPPGSPLFKLALCGCP